MKKFSIKQQIRGLEIILETELSEEPFISREYVLEKLKKIREGSLDMHELVKEALKQEAEYIKQKK